MNKYAQEIIIEFASRENANYLHTSLVRVFNHPKVFRFLEEHLHGAIRNFAGLIQQEMSVSDPMPGITIMDQLNSFNNQFIRTQIGFIKSHVLMTDDDAPRYVVHDDMPTSRHGLAHHQQAPNNILRSWLSDSGRGVQLREDTPGDITGHGAYNPYYGIDGATGPNYTNHLTTGIAFCDQREIGTQNHVEQYENTSYKHALNRNVYPHEATPFGVSTPGADARLLSRRSFRRNEAGAENGIPRYESRLYNRFLERDITDGLHNAEKGHLLSGHDMTSIHRRLDHKHAAHARWDMSVPSHLRLQHGPNMYY